MENERTVTGMAEYIERTEELMLSMRAGARAISNTKKYHGTIYMYDAFSDNPKEMPYLQAAEILYAASEEKSADVAPVRHGRWIEPQRLYYGAKQYECSLCWAEEFWDKHGITEKYPCCPNCGAKMDLEVTNDA